MQTPERLRDLRNLNYLLFGGLTEKEFYRRHRQKRYPMEESDEIITGYVEFNLDTGEITPHDMIISKGK